MIQPAPLARASAEYAYKQFQPAPLARASIKKTRLTERAYNHDPACAACEAFTTMIKPALFARLPRTTSSLRCLRGFHRNTLIINVHIPGQCLIRRPSWAAVMSSFYSRRFWGSSRFSSSSRHESLALNAGLQLELGRRQIDRGRQDLQKVI